MVVCMHSETIPMMYGVSPNWYLQTQLSYSSCLLFFLVLWNHNYSIFKMRIQILKPIDIVYMVFHCFICQRKLAVMFTEFKKSWTCFLQPPPPSPGWGTLGNTGCYACSLMQPPIRHPMSLLRTGWPWCTKVAFWKGMCGNDEEQKW